MLTDVPKCILRLQGGDEGSVLFERMVTIYQITGRHVQRKRSLNACWKKLHVSCRPFCQYILFT